MKFKGPSSVQGSIFGVQGLSLILDSGAPHFQRLIPDSSSHFVALVLSSLMILYRVGVQYTQGVRVPICQTLSFNNNF